MLIGKTGSWGILNAVDLQCCELAAKLAGDLEREGIKGKTLTLKLKPPTFEVSTDLSSTYAPKVLQAPKTCESISTEVHALHALP